MINKRGAIFLIVWNIFEGLFFFSCTTNLLTCSWKWVTVIEYGIIAALSPVIGLAADCWMGRYKVFKMAQYLTLLAILLKVIGKEIFHVDYVLQSAIAVMALAGSSYTACILQFTMNQLVGASGEQFAFAIYWLVWGGFTTASISNVFYYNFCNGSEYLLHGLSAVPILIAVLMMECWNHWLMKKPLLSDRIKHIAKVLNYAKKPKYPE